MGDALIWGERHSELEAITDHGIYSIDAPDSLGQRQVSFWSGLTENFVAIKYTEEDAIAAAEHHFDWLLGIQKKEPFRS